METQVQNFESALRELLTPIIHHAVDEAMERHFSVLLAGKPIALPETTQEFLDVKKAAEHLSLAKNTIYALIYRKAITYYKSTRKVYFKKADLDKYIMHNRVERTDEMD